MTREIVRTLTFQGIRVSIETDKGQVRHWRDEISNTHGKTLFKYPYGFFNGTKNANNESGDHMALDVFVGPDEDAEHVYVIHQMKRPDFKKEDELKVMVGFESPKHARISYLIHYNDERFLGEMETYTVSAFKEKFITPFINKALAGKDVGQILSSAAGNTEQFVNPAGIPSLPTVPNPMPLGVSMKPPIDVETYEGVKALLGRIGDMKDTELLQVAEDTWGPGYSYINATEGHVRCEILGFLLDQRDLLEPQQNEQILGNSQDQTSSLSLPPSINGQESTSVPSSEVNSSVMESNEQPLTDSSQAVPLHNPKTDPFNASKSQTESLRS